MTTGVATTGRTASVQISLIYELLDAHDDTARLASGLQADPEWRTHLDYLRDLQRVGREMVARLDLEVAR
jgi:hypothetical protein